MMLTIGDQRYRLADHEDTARVLDDALNAARSGAGLVRFATIDGVLVTAVVTAHVPVAVTDYPSVTRAVGETANDAGLAFWDFDAW
ncbi:hypothetical protein [Herbiconiux daphne]|uniref:Uncharacterized protein n=1 Tax=Herbiconiux daphne TaxID=2970914 RepID=A0ABT2GX02_9MICO|nr:hypothetical protein [Herbiconiux daphne]MCS5732436.1 hypothetical protein [Herbiconiux daphne]